METKANPTAIPTDESKATGELKIGPSKAPWRLAPAAGYATGEARSHFDIEDHEGFTIAVTVDLPETEKEPDRKEADRIIAAASTESGVSTDRSQIIANVESKLNAEKLINERLHAKGDGSVDALCHYSDGRCDAFYTVLELLKQSTERDSLRTELEAASERIAKLREAIVFALTTPGMIKGRDKLIDALEGVEADGK